MLDDFGINAGYVEELRTRWMESPLSVEESWRQFFEHAKDGQGTTNGRAGRSNGKDVSTPPGRSTDASYHAAVAETVIAATELQSRVAHLVNGYRARGHVFANVDPLETVQEAAPELALSHFG